jgi:hypothetical protein
LHFFYPFSSWSPKKWRRAKKTIIRRSARIKYGKSFIKSQRRRRNIRKMNSMVISAGIPDRITFILPHL